MKNLEESARDLFNFANLYDKDVIMLNLSDRGVEFIDMEMTLNRLGFRVKGKAVIIFKREPFTDHNDAESQQSFILK